MKLPLCPFPSAHWLLLACSDECLELDFHEHYIKQTYRNRFDILGVNGRHSLTIPVQGQKGQKTMMKDILLEDGNWRKLNLTAIKSAYGRSAYFEHYIDAIEHIFISDQKFLIDFNLATLHFIKPFTSISHWTTTDAHKSYSDLSETQKMNMQRFEPSHQWSTLPSYSQVFSDRFPFQSNLSALDMVFNLGPRAVDYLLLIKNGEQLC